MCTHSAGPPNLGAPATSHRRSDDDDDDRFSLLAFHFYYVVVVVCARSLAYARVRVKIIAQQTHSTARDMRFCVCMSVSTIIMLKLNTNILLQFLSKQRNRI